MVPQAISRLLDMLLQNLSADVHHVVECITDGHSPSALAVLWRVRGRQSNLLHAKVHPLLCSHVVCTHTRAEKGWTAEAHGSPDLPCVTGHHIHAGQQSGADLLHTRCTRAPHQSTAADRTCGQSGNIHACKVGRFCITSVMHGKSPVTCLQRAAFSHAGAAARGLRLMLSLQCASIPGPLGGQQHGPVPAPAGGLTTYPSECRPGPEPVGQHHCQRPATTGMPLEPLLCRRHIWFVLQA